MKPCGCTEGECWKRALRTGQHCRFGEPIMGPKAREVLDFNLYLGPDDVWHGEPDPSLGVGRSDA